MLGAEASADDPGETASKLNLKRDDRDGVDGAKIRGLFRSCMAENEVDSLMRPGVEGRGVAFPRKLMLSTNTRKVDARPLSSVSISSRKPSIETYVLFDGIGFFVLYLFELKCAWTGKVESVR